MRLIMENWRKFLTQEEKEIKDKIVDKLEDEGGAAGKEPLEDALKGVDLPDGFELKDFLKGMKDVGQHEEGDYILDDDEEIDVEKKDLEEAIQFFLEEQELFLDEKRKKKRKKKKKSSGKKDACYRKVKSRYKVWPSAYASGALVRCRKVGASNWGNKSKKKKK